MDELETLKRENNLLTALLCSRNKLIEDLLIELPADNGTFEKGMRMRRKSWQGDKEIYIKYPPVKKKHQESD